MKAPAPIAPVRLCGLVALVLGIVFAAPGVSQAKTKVDTAVAIGGKAAPKPDSYLARCLRKARTTAAPRRARRHLAYASRRRSAAGKCQTGESTASVSSAEAVSSSSPAGPLVVGIDGGYSGWWAEEIELRKNLNAAVTRHQWDPGSPVNAQDKFMLEATELVHTRIHAVLGGDELGNPTQYKEWVIAFIRRYGAGGSFWAEHPTLDQSRYAITSFELGNEPYFSVSASGYAEYIRPTLEAVAQLGLPAELIIPTYTEGSDTRWTDTLYQKIPNLNSLFYAFAEHPYWYGHSPSDTSTALSPFGRIEALRRDMAAHGAADKALFITEYGESTASCGSECTSEAGQAQHIQEMLTAVLTHPEWRVEQLDFYQLHDWAMSSTEREQQFGLLRADGTPKPAYAIVSAAVQKYRG